MSRRLPYRASALLGAVALAAAPAAPAAEPPPGATSCSGCHAPGGRVSSPSIPPLGGLAAADIARALAEYRSGERPGTVMDRIARGFTEAEGEAIARWLEATR